MSLNKKECIKCQQRPKKCVSLSFSYQLITKYRGTKMLTIQLSSVPIKRVQFASSSATVKLHNQA